MIWTTFQTILEFVNSHEGTIRQNGELLKTSKKDKRSHGFGLSNLRKAVRNYNGDIMIETAETGLFKLTVMIPLPPSEKH